MSEFTHAELKLRFAESLDVIDRLTEQLNSKQDALSAALLALDYAVSRVMELEAEAMEEAKVWQDRYRKRGYVMDEHAKALERAEVAEAELARYKQGVEVDGLVAYENYPWPIRTLDTALEKFHHECVRVLVMKVEEE